MEKSQMENLKLNYHLVEACNYGCKFCFARYEQKQKTDFELMKAVVKNTAESGFFNSINFAGGEPFLIKQLPSLIRFAKNQGLSTSVITNGSMLSESVIDSVLPYLDCIGISFHSVSDDIKRKIGSCDKNGTVLTNERLLEICRYIRKNSDCKIKLNTVVNAFNKNENFVPFIRELNIDRWKVLRCQSFGCNEDMLINDKEWTSFCARNYGLKNTVFENNMKDTYIMVNPAGFLIKESSDGKNYEPIGSVLSSNIRDLLLEHPLHIDEYKMRYSA